MGKELHEKQDDRQQLNLGRHCNYVHKDDTIYRLEITSPTRRPLFFQIAASRPSNTRS